MAPRSPDLSPPDADDIHDMAFANRGCCFCFPGPNGDGSIWWQRIARSDPGSSGRSGLIGSHGGDQEPVWKRGWKKVREWSELVAGPKWKTFIRRFNRNRSMGKGMKYQKYNYDPLSYAMNFDNGPGQNGHFCEDDFRVEFSARYASLPSSAKSSMDLDRDMPTLT